MITPAAYGGRPPSGFVFLDGSFVPYISYELKEKKFDETENWYIVYISKINFQSKTIEQWLDEKIRVAFVDEDCKIRFCKIFQINNNNENIMLKLRCNIMETTLTEYEMEYVRKGAGYVKEYSILSRWEILDL